MRHVDMSEVLNTQAHKVDLTKQFLDQAKSLADLREVYRSPQVTLLLTNGLPFGLCLETEIFQAAYGDPTGREYWAANFSEPLVVYKFARVLAVHLAGNPEQPDLATAAIILALRGAAEAGEDWFIGDTMPLLALEGTPSSFETLGRIKVHPRAAVSWLLSKPKREHLVPDSLRSFLQFDQVSGKPRPVTEKTAERFVDDYINSQQGQGRRPTLKGLEAAAKKANLPYSRASLT
jgi:hypothetical protein